ncbi:PLP-dependent aminotransferase family protein [Paracoccus litorisediminis]|uniref:Aminotransferase class I/II-fold pyridoxal phosphate-dependent enzyme n=1 Tax=Paracoccus litorisediminis TaxID=2006130 RepID=A0A844HPK4_9RHOB|nr:PLP-dependent aminotransferase family protein [Paracoccus litorisediminis]MTH60988.1 aminotransferase class I/II-fold pyridoxal phosphate-dependent enzyme [Paracoccus litorisediminis]
MARRPSGAILTWISLDRGSHVSLAQQLKEQLRNAIVSGVLPGGAKLPSSRMLAAEFSISRPTAVLALEGLEAEGFLEMRHGAGTFVAGSVPQHLPRAMAREDAAAGAGAHPQLSEMGARLQDLTIDIEARQARPFLPNTPAYDRFPFALWQKCVNRQTRLGYRSNLGYAEPQGYAPLRKAIANYLALHRSDACHHDQIVITPGAHAGFMLAAMLLTNPGDGILVEDPGPYIARNMFASLGRRIVTAPVDGDGMAFEEILAKDPGIRMVFVMPSRQHPTGTTLALERRLKLLDWAEAHGGWIIEDDYDSEFRYTGRPLPSMHSADRFGRVIYVGTFSKALFPALRVGYLVLPPVLIDMFRNAMALMFRCAPLPSQMTLTEFISEGHFATHLRQMRELYGERRDRFLTVARQVGAGLFHVERPDSGMNALLWLPDGLDDRMIAERAKDAGVHGYALSDYWMRPSARPGLILGFSGVTPQQLEPGLEALARIVADALR